MKATHTFGLVALFFTALLVVNTYLGGGEAPAITGYAASGVGSTSSASSSSSGSFPQCPNPGSCSDCDPCTEYCLVISDPEDECNYVGCMSGTHPLCGAHIGCPPDECDGTCQDGSEPDPINGCGGGAGSSSTSSSSSSTCAMSCDCSADTCSGSFCRDSCDFLCVGSKSCPSSSSSSSSSSSTCANTCGDGTCDECGTGGEDAGSCPADCYTCIPITETCNNNDEDCDGSIDEGCDDDLDDYCDAAMTYSGSTACPNGGGDCNDGAASIRPGATEVCGNNVDENCDSSDPCCSTNIYLEDTAPLTSQRYKLRCDYGSYSGVMPYVTVPCDTWLGLESGLQGNTIQTWSCLYSSVAPPNTYCQLDDATNWANGRPEFCDRTDSTALPTCTAATLYFMDTQQIDASTYRLRCDYGDQRVYLNVPAACSWTGFQAGPRGNTIATYSCPYASVPTPYCEVNQDMGISQNGAWFCYRYDTISCNCPNVDNDGHYPTTCTNELCTPRDDCDDSRIDTFPGAGETCGDSVDQNCNGFDLPCAPAGLAGSCSDGIAQLSWGPAASAAGYAWRSYITAAGWQGCGVGGSLCSGVSAQTTGSFPATPGTTYSYWTHGINGPEWSQASSTFSFCCVGSEQCNNVDDDCNGVVDAYTNATGCNQVGACAGAARTCAAGAWSACSKLPAAETCNFIDDDCDGVVDNGVRPTYYYDFDDDTFGVTGNTRTDLCAPSGLYRALQGNDCDDAHAAVYPGAAELCKDGLNNPCGITPTEYDVDTQDWPTPWAGDGNPSAHGDSACPVTINAATILEPDYCPGDVLHIECDVSPEGVSSVAFSMNNVSCVWAGWSGSKARYDCTVNPGVNVLLTARCAVDGALSYQGGADQTATINFGACIETSCSNNFDDDVDGYIDEADNDCALSLAVAPSSQLPLGLLTATISSPDGLFGTGGRRASVCDARGCGLDGLCAGAAANASCLLMPIDGAAAASCTLRAPAAEATHTYHACLGLNDRTATVDVEGVCGDGNKSASESCDGLDFGNPAPDCTNFSLVNGDLFCNGDCTFNLSSCLTCGNGRIEASEQCDDGNQVEGDGCGLTCLLEPPVTNCNNNGVLDAGEECDGGDYGGQTCLDIDDYTGGHLACIDCTIDPSGCTREICNANGIIEGGEECDDGASNGEPCAPAPACGGTCTYCSNLCQPIEVTGPFCGDGIQNCGEACDDGAENNGAAPARCSDTCTLNPVVCNNNGVVDAGEQCDLGAQNGVACTPGYEEECQYCDTCSWRTLRGTRCGDAAVNGPPGAEQCDLGALSEGGRNGLVCEAPYGGTCAYCSQLCTNAVATGASCGDGIINGPPGAEQCDDGAANNGPVPNACDANCQLNIVLPTCNDNVVQLPEECDDDSDGTPDNGEGCSPPYAGDCTYCSQTCANFTAAGPRCGDGLLDLVHEECDGPPAFDCKRLGFARGPLECTAACRFDTSRCRGDPPDRPARNSSLRGYVWRAESQPLGGASVSIFANIEHNANLSLGSGLYRIGPIPPGTYQIGASKTGYRSVTATRTIPRNFDAQYDFTLTDGSCSECTDWERRCSVACSGAPLCGATVPAVCEGHLAGDWVLNATGDGYLQCCKGAPTKPYVNSTATPEGCMRDLVAFNRLVSYHGQLVTMRVYTWEPCPS